MGHIGPGQRVLGNRSRPEVKVSLFLQRGSRVVPIDSLTAAWRPLQTPRKSSSAGVDATFATDELIQGLRIRLVGRGVPHRSAPFAPRPLVGFDRVGGTPDDGGERVFSARGIQAP
jgi:hypothetical protein